MASDRHDAALEGYYRELKGDWDTIPGLRKAHGFVLRQEGSEGDYLILPASRIQEARRCMLKHGLRNLEINETFGSYWQRDVDFLCDFPFLEGVSVVGLGIRDVRAVQELAGLRYLSLSNDCRTPLDFRRFPHLLGCSLRWVPKRDSIFDCLTLRHLGISNYPGSDILRFERLRNLESLGLVTARNLASLSGLSALTRLTRLELAYLPQVRSLAPLSTLRRLEWLDMQRLCRVQDLGPVRRLTRLRTLLVNDCGDIKNIRPLAALRRLEYVSLGGSTKVSDGDLSVLLGLPKLAKAVITPHRGYSHRGREITPEHWAGSRPKKRKKTDKKTATKTKRKIKTKKRKTKKTKK